MKFTAWKRKFSSGGLLYVILDSEVTERNHIDIVSLADKLSAAGTDILQFRFTSLTDNQALKTAEKLVKVIHSRKKIFIINNRADIAYLCGADGLHVGKDDIPPELARRILGKKSIIGKTAHSPAELKQFQNQDVDYVSVGPIFKTETKPELKALKTNHLLQMLGGATKSVFAIGGINLYNIDPLVKLGINNACVCRAIILNKDPKSTVKKFKQCLKRISSKK